MGDEEVDHRRWHAKLKLEKMVSFLLECFGFYQPVLCKCYLVYEGFWFYFQQQDNSKSTLSIPFRIYAERRHTNPEGCESCHHNC